MSSDSSYPVSVQSDASTADCTQLAEDPAFHGLLITQFLGAFNDNYFKQMVLLKCTELAATAQVDLQPLAMAAFALPFILLSGLGGYVSDRCSKRNVIVWCKVAEIVVMSASLWVLFFHAEQGATQLRLLILVLAFMGAQSAMFGPSKYGVLPELFRPHQLLPVNGAIQMTLFLAIIFGMAGAGIALDKLNNSLWLCSTIAVVIAVAGTVTALFIRATPAAHPELKMEVGNLLIPRDVRILFRTQPRIFRAMLVMMLFWFIGGVAQPAVNNLGEHVLHLSKTRTSLMAASIGVGIALGCAVSGFANRGGIVDGNRWTTRGSWMIVASLLLIALLGSGALGYPRRSDAEIEGILRSLAVADSVEWMMRGGMLLLGLSAGIFVVPLQVYVQQAPPAESKGRMIGAMNVITWVGILLSAAFLIVMNGVMSAIGGEEHRHDYQFLVFAALAGIMLPIAGWYRLPALEMNAPATNSES